MNCCSKLKGINLSTTHPFATKLNSVKLACVKHTTSVHPEPGSNSYCFNYKYLH